MIAKFGKRKKSVFFAISFLGIIAVVFILFAIIYLSVSNIQIQKKKARLDRQVEAMQKEIEDFEKKNAELREGIEKVGDLEYVEKIAREELNLQKEGEKVMGFILPPGYQTQSASVNYWNPGSWWSWVKGKWAWIVNKL